jgi:hypothetical protein
LGHGNGLREIARKPEHSVGCGYLAYDCRRTAYFTEQLYAALTLIDRGILSAGTRRSMHGEIGHTQFLPKSILNYGTGGNLDIAANALACKISSGLMAGARARDISPAKPISSYPGMECCSGLSARHCSYWPTN